MKLRNKKTGEIGELHFEPDKEYHFTVVTEDPADLMIFKTLAELNEEWEDYEEPKEYWFIRDHTSIVGYAPVNNSDAAKYRKEIVGNYFETKEEAERAVEKLKAWKRLKDKEFEFLGYTALGCGEINFMLDWEDIDEKQLKKDMDLLFGGEE